MNFCIMNVDKQGRAAVYGLQIEANREQNDGREFDRSDIDKNRTKDNIFLRRTENWNEEITRQIHSTGVKERKGSVVAITGVFTASPEWFNAHSKEEWLSYFKDCLAFFDKTYCKAFNAVIHLDEQTPHMQVVGVPIIEDEKGFHLSAKIIMGGRNDYRTRQDQFYEQVGRQYGMERGERREPAEVKAHTTKREWQIATQEQRLEQAQQATIREQERTKAVLDRRQASIDEANRQKLEALRERDAARADRDVVKGLQGLQKAVFEPVQVEVDVLHEKPARRSLFGRQKPATVTITKEQLEGLQAQAVVNRRVEQAAQDIAEAYQGMQNAAELANRNKIDVQALAEKELIREYVFENERLQSDLTQERADHTRTKERLRVAEQERKRADLTAQEITKAYQGLQARAKNLERFCEGLTMTSGETVLEYFKATEQARQHDSMSRSRDDDDFER